MTRLPLFVCFAFILTVSCRSYHQPWVELPSYYHHDPLPRRETPLDFMVHVVNRFGLRLLEEHSKDNTLHNLALSPYGATSVLVAIAEGISGSSREEIFNGANLPCDISVLRIGLRDMHRHLKSYFIPKEGFLAGLTLNSDNVTVTPQYESVLRFYGYDVASFNSALLPMTNSSTNATTTTTTSSTNNGTSNATSPTVPPPTMATSETQEANITNPTLADSPASTTAATPPPTTTEANSEKDMEIEARTTTEPPEQTTSTPDDDGGPSSTTAPETTTQEVTTEAAKEETTTSAPTGASNNDEETTSKPTGGDEEATSKPTGSGSTGNAEEETTSTPLESPSTESSAADEVTTSKPSESSSTEAPDTKPQQDPEVTAPAEGTTGSESSPMKDPETTVSTPSGSAEISPLTSEGISVPSAPGGQESETPSTATTEAPSTASGADQNESTGSETTEAAPTTSPTEDPETKPTTGVSGPTGEAVNGPLTGPGSSGPAEETVSTTSNDEVTTAPPEEEAPATGGTTSTEEGADETPSQPPETESSSPSNDAELLPESTPGISPSGDENAEMTTELTESTAAGTTANGGEEEDDEGEEEEDEEARSRTVPSNDVEAILTPSTAEGGDKDSVRKREDTAGIELSETADPKSEDLKSLPLKVQPDPDPLNESPLLGFQNTNRVIRNGKRSSALTRKRRNVPRKGRHIQHDIVYSRYYDEFHLPAINTYGFERPRPRPITFLVNGVTPSIDVRFMNYDTVLPFHFSPELNAMALRFPLDIPKYYLLLVLPVDEQGVDKLICHMSAQCDLKYLIKKLKNTYVKATIPSFQLRGVVSLRQTLQKLSIRKIFEPMQTNFTKMTTSEKDIYVTNVEQAVTVTIKNYLIQPPGRYGYGFNPIIFRATHPFLYFVMDSQLDVALMAGKITNPSNYRIR